MYSDKRTRLSYGRLDGQVGTISTATPPLGCDIASTLQQSPFQGITFEAAYWTTLGGQTNEWEPALN
ncbi:hypothetical protein E2C01_050585 [Portunus trituberculatus]|uniref:Uncharacterized protein n=1 Tax=Portunus trituberculatus TaxID=210409 RepID=A0A5B7G9E5_PORTR|nr:hypothetical protein [Portunus trituberculatus]